VGTAATRDEKHWLAAAQVEGTAPPRIAALLNWQDALNEAQE